MTLAERTDSDRLDDLTDEVRALVRETKSAAALNDKLLTKISAQIMLVDVLTALILILYGIAWLFG